ncbi:sigma 54-interacting transcriptional regulator [Candidatus Sumerlaeota bacterium]|nr:sigma 54-interacting transcriptional regulator [Candidatus Sumerlaeota bacterium]
MEVPNLRPAAEKAAPERTNGRSHSSPATDHAHAYQEGVRAFANEDFAGARRKFHSLLLGDAGNAEVLAACGHCALHEGDARKAAEFYARAESENSALPDVLYRQALLMIQSNDWEPAAQRLVHLSKSPPEIREGTFYLGLLFDSTTEFLCDVRLHLGQMALDQGNEAEARGWYLQSLEAKQDNVTALQRLGELAILSKKYIEAIGHLNRILETSPLEDDRINAHNNLGIAYYENGALEEAINHLTYVLRHAPSNATAIHNINFIYEREGIFHRPDQMARGIRFVDVAEGAQPIFELTDVGELNGSAEVAIIGKSAEMLRVMRLARIAAARDTPVLIRGENGTGKELLAQVIALNSSRRDAPFSVLNCAAMPEVLLESEIFGHEKGAFTGARAPKQGRFELARGGTIFLDEVSGLSPMLQGKLYRALNDGRFLPVGGTRTIPVEVRIIAATNRDLQEMIAQGLFREDFYYLLNVIGIELPPLRERRADIPLLVDFFLDKFSRRSNVSKARVSAEDLQILMDHEWPGNIRELENLIQRSVVMGSKSSLYLEELVRLRRTKSTTARETAGFPEKIAYPIEITLAELEKRHIISVLESCNHHQKKAAQILGINPSTLWRKLKQYGLESAE